MIDEFFVRAQVQPRIVMETENVEIIKSMVASGIGSTLISNHAIDREVKAGDAHRAPPAGSAAGPRNGVGLPEGQPRAAARSAR